MSKITDDLYHSLTYEEPSLCPFKEGDFIRDTALPFKVKVLEVRKDEISVTQLSERTKPFLIERMWWSTYQKTNPPTPTKPSLKEFCLEITTQFFAMMFMISGVSMLIIPEDRSKFSVNLEWLPSEMAMILYCVLYAVLFFIFGFHSEKLKDLRLKREKKINSL